MSLEQNATINYLSNLQPKKLSFQDLMMMHVTLCDMLASFDPVTKLTWDTIINATLTQDDPSKCQSHADAISDYQNKCFRC